MVRRELAHLDGDLGVEMVGEINLELRCLAHHPDHLPRGGGGGGLGPARLGSISMVEYTYSRGRLAMIKWAEVIHIGPIVSCVRYAPRPEKR